MSVSICILRAAGGVEFRRAERREFAEIIGAASLDTFRHPQGGSLVWVDDEGHRKGLPVNAEATRLYRMICRPGTTHEIRGDAIIARDVF